MLPEYYEFFNPVKIMAGRDALDNLAFEMKRIHSDYPILLTDQGIKRAGLLKLVLDVFEETGLIPAAVYDNIPPDSSVETVNELVDLYRDKGCDAIIALGGGSVIDTAKGLNVALSEESSDIMDNIGVDRAINPTESFVIIPTTSGTGSEVTQVAVISHRESERKLLFSSPLILPDMAVLDPRLTLTLPPHITAATGMDALVHAVEAYSCLQKNPLSDSYATTAIKLIRENLVQAVQKGSDKRARFAMANASLLAGVAFSNSMVGAVHSLGHAAGAVSHVAHGVLMAILLPPVMEYNMGKVAALYGELLLYLGGAERYSSTAPNQRAAEAVKVVRELNLKLNRLCGLPLTLKEAGVKEADLDLIAEKAIVDGSIICNPEELTFDEARRLLNSVFS